tara:strand:+ start:1349 stop:2263 length:915 start_codon:yes stop_codon:yes gene_type:complete
MSTLTIHDLQGFSTYSNQVRVPSGHRLQVEGTMKLPTWTTSTRPTPVEGLIGVNTTEKQLECYVDGAWSKAAGGGVQGLTAADPVVDTTTWLTTNPPDGDYWFKPTGYSGNSIQVYVNTSNAPSSSAYVQIARGRESTNWWQTSGQNFVGGGLTSTYLSQNTPIAVAPNDFCSALCNFNWSSARIMTNRRNSGDSWYFEGGTSTSWSWSYFPQNSSSVNASAVRTSGLWRTGSTQQNWGQGNRWTDTLAYGGGNNCDRTFMWSWGGHGPYQGWSGGSSCNPSGGFQNGNEGHSIQLVNVYMLIQ